MSDSRLADNRRTCIFVDIDGTIMLHPNSSGQFLDRNPILLPNVKEVWSGWLKKGYNIIVTTGRRESSRDITVKQLEGFGLHYDALIMNCGTGPRIVINDMNPTFQEPSAYAVNLIRNAGFVSDDGGDEFVKDLFETTD